jgi:hypothetical protein
MADASDPAFEQLMLGATEVGTRFGHREHVKLTWLAVRRYELSDACAVIADGIRRTARYQGVPQKYNATMTRAWVEVIAHHARELPDASFDEFVGAHPAVLDKRLLARHYRSTTLAGHAARTGWVPPDLAPFPWS